MLSYFLFIGDFDVGSYVDDTAPSAAARNYDTVVKILNTCRVYFLWCGGNRKSRKTG